MRKINILHVINSMEPGGAENLLKFQIPYYDSNKFNIHIGYLIGAGSLFDQNNTTESHVKIIDFSNNGKFTYSSLFKINKYIKDNNIDIVHAHLMQSGIITKLISIFNQKIKIISTRHYGKVSKQYRLINKIDNFLLNYDNKIICISKYVKEYLCELGVPNDKLKVIYNGIELEDYINVNKMENENFTIGTVARLNSNKGIDTLLLSFKKIIQDFPNSKLKIIGDGPLMQKYIDLSYELGISKNVTFMGYLQPEEVLLNMSKWNLFILASKLEAFGMVLIEAGALSIPVIATKVDAIPEIIKDNYNGYLVDVNSPEQIYRKTLQLMNSSKLCIEMGQNGLDNVKKYFSIFTMVKDTQEVYLEILNT